MSRRPQRSLANQPASPRPEGQAWMKGQPPSIIRKGWPQSPSHFLAPHATGFGYRGEKRSRRAVVREGHRFEGKVLDGLLAAEGEGWYLLNEFKLAYKTTSGIVRSVYIDILAINPAEGKLYVLECKRSHTASSYRQIWRYMAMVLSYFGDGWSVSGYEVCLYQGFTFEYPGPHRYISPGKIPVIKWAGYGTPTVGIVPWYTGRFTL